MWEREKITGINYEVHSPSNQNQSSILNILRSHLDKHPYILSQLQLLDDGKKKDIYLFYENPLQHILKFNIEGFHTLLTNILVQEANGIEESYERITGKSLGNIHTLVKSRVDELLSTTK